MYYLGQEIESLIINGEYESVQSYIIKTFNRKGGYGQKAYEYACKRNKDMLETIVMIANKYKHFELVRLCFEQAKEHKLEIEVRTEEEMLEEQRLQEEQDRKVEEEREEKKKEEQKVQKLKNEILDEQFSGIGIFMEEY